MTLRHFLNKVIQKVVVFFMPVRIVYNRSEQEVRKSMRTRTEEELALRAKDLHEICAILDKFSIPYYLAGGTLLGIVRDGDFIPWDTDVDIDVRIEDVYPKQTQIVTAFVQAGFEIKMHRPSKIDFKIKAVKHGDTAYEIIGYLKMDDMRYKKWSHFPGSFMRGTSEVVLRGRRYKTFAEPEQYLTWYYGDWRTPIQSESHLGYMTEHSLTRPLALMRLRLAGLFVRF